MGIKQAEALCNGEREATNDDIINIWETIPRFFRSSALF